MTAEGPEEPNGFWSTINTGVFALRRGTESERLLALMREIKVPAVEERWDSAADGTLSLIHI